MRQIPKKNYALLLLIVVITVFCVLYVANWYKATQEYYSQSSIMTTFLGEIKETEIDNYILENPDVVIYVSAGQTNNTRKFENKLKNYITKENIKSQFIYFNCSVVSSEFISKFKNKYFNGSLKKITLSYPNILIVQDGKVVDVLYKLGQEPNIKDAKKFLVENGVTFDA